MPPTTVDNTHSHGGRSLCFNDHAHRDASAIMPDTLTETAWQAVERLLARTNAPHAVRFAVAVGCPRHGNAAMDWDDNGAYCSRCEVGQ